MSKFPKIVLLFFEILTSNFCPHFGEKDEIFWNVTHTSEFTVPLVNTFRVTINKITNETILIKILNKISKFLKNIIMKK